MEKLEIRISPEAKLMKEYVSLRELYDSGESTALERVWVGRERHVLIRPVAGVEAYLNVPESVQGFIGLEDAYGVVAQHSRGGLHGSEYAFCFGLQECESGIFHMHWLSRGYSLTDHMAGVGKDEVALIIVTKSTIQLRTGSPAKLKKKGFNLPREETHLGG